MRLKEDTLLPIYEGASYGGETVKVDNSKMRVEIHKRLTGWGWAEIFNATGQLIAVLDHFGEVKLPGLAIPLRMEAQKYELEKGEFGQRLTFPVTLTSLSDMAGTSSFKSWFKLPFTQPAIEGKVTVTLDPEFPVLRMTYEFKLLAILEMSYLRGPWLEVGADSFGAAKDDGIFPGLEWLVGNEWSSGTDWFQHPWALRVVPHPFKVAAGLMALSHDGTGIGLAWDPLANFAPDRPYPQPVFASPNFIDRKNDHIMGLMLPSVAWGAEENVLEADPPLELRTNSTIKLEAEVFLVEGDSLDVMIDWVKRHGLPEPPKPRYPLSEALDRIARAYNSNLWYEGKGWGMNREGNGAASPAEPLFMERYIKDGHDRESAKGLAEKLEWVRGQPTYETYEVWGGSRRFKIWSPEKRLEYGRQLLSYQREDGSFPFEPDGRHSFPDHSALSDGTLKPLGKKGDTALDLCVQPAIDLLILADMTGEKSFREAAKKALDYCLSMKRPEGGDWWETPLHSPNLLAAGHAAIAYYLGYKSFKDPRYLKKAVRWIRSLLPFTHLWEPYRLPQMYNTKPCFCATDWWLSDWVARQVQWEVLQTFAQSAELGIDWGKIDPEIGWHRYQKGITIAVLRWMIDHENTVNTALSLDRVKSGDWDALFHDAHHTTTGTYGGGPIMPDVIAVNIFNVLDRE